MNEVKTQKKQEKVVLGFTTRDTRRALDELIRAFGHDPVSITVEDLQVIADKLSQIAAKDPPWGWRYLRNLLNDKIEASEKLTRAIFALGASVDGVNEELAGAQQVMVMVPAGVKVHPGALILSHSQPCANPACGLHFVPRTPRQKYHSRACGRQDAKRRRQEQQHEIKEEPSGKPGGR